MKIICILLSLAAAAAAWNVPDRFANGVYEITFLANTHGDEGTVAQYDIDPYLNITAKTKDTKLPLPKDRIDCAEYVDGLSQYHNAADDVLAMEMLGNWCERYSPRKGALVVAVHNTNIWYVCNWDAQHNMMSVRQTCGREEIYEANILIDRQCKQMKAGELHTGKWMKHYGRGVRRGSICNGIEEAGK